MVELKIYLKRKWTDILFYTIFFVLLIGQLQVTLGKPVSLAAFVAVESNSMVPTFERGDILLVLRTDEIREGEIILFRSQFGSPIVHRVIEIKDNGYITKGDNNPTTDQARMGIIKKEQVLAEVFDINGYIFKVPKLGYLSLWIRGR